MTGFDPCPFCARPIQYRNIKKDNTYWSVYCEHCDTDMGHIRPYDYGQWNTRPIEDALRARIAELEAQVASLTLQAWEPGNEQIGKLYWPWG